MNAKKYSLNYDGYWRGQKAGSIPAKTGVYSVYACKYNQSAGTVTVRKLIYIGESKNVRGRIIGHEKISDWRTHLTYGEELCFNFAPIDIDRLRVEAALINHHKPPENVEHKHNFPFPQTSVTTAGANTLLDNSFTVYPNVRSRAV